MFYFTREGETPRNGFNFYHLSDTNNAGFKLRLGRFMFMFRWSKLMKRLSARGWIVPKQQPEWMKEAL
jgi:hypothetical protein